MTEKESPSEDVKPVPTVWIAVAVIVFFGGIVAIGLLTSQPNADEYVYNGFAFQEVPCEIERCWETTVISNVGTHPVLFFYGPREVDNISVDQRAVARVLNLTTIANSSVIIAFDEGVPGEVGVAASNVARITGDRFYRIPTTGAIYGEMITCAQSTPQQTVIYLTQNEQAGVFFEDDCVIIAAPTTMELLKVADAYTLRLLRIIR